MQGKRSKRDIRMRIHAGHHGHPGTGNSEIEAAPRCATTSTSSGVINLELDEEWLMYEKLTETILSRSAREATKRPPPLSRDDHHGFADASRRRGNEKLAKHGSNVSGSVAGIVFDDERADGDKRAEASASLPIRNSLFPNVPPYIHFNRHDRLPGKLLPKDFSRLLKWKFTVSMPRVLVRILVASGYQIVNKGHDWSGIWNLSMKDTSMRQRLKSFQKVNTIPGSHHIGNKDQLWTHLHRMSMKFGPDAYGYMPRTYILPREIQKFESMWYKRGIGTTWIIKPPASGRGQGIRIVNQWWEIPKWHPMIIQRYISRPKLINGLKFDLRVYVLLTSINPMRVYIYTEGLVRFASVRYVRGANLSDKYMHLTNSSVNKHNPNYVTNDAVDSFRGHKWSFSSLWSYLSEEGVNVPELWTRIKDIVVKTIIAAESSMNATISEYPVSGYSCYELYGFDVLLDETTRPWLLEVNILPSLQTNSPLDAAIKGPLVRNILNMVGYQIPRCEQISDKLTAGNKKYDAIAHDYRLYSTALSLHEKAKQNEINAMLKRDEYRERILEQLTRDDIRQLVRFEDELSQAGGFEKIFPTRHTCTYLKFFEVERYYDRLLDAWEHRYSDDRTEGIRLLQKACETMQHLEPTADSI